MHTIVLFANEAISRSNSAQTIV